MTKPGILLLTIAPVSCMLLTACADSFAAPNARSVQSPGSNQQEPVSPESGSAGSKATENRELLVRFAVKTTLFWKAGATRLS